MEKDLVIQNKALLEENKKLKIEIKDLNKIAYFDNLTGAYNRNWFYSNINYNDKWYITIVDLNGLKKVNDSLGHAEGDKFIVRVVDILKQYGSVVRYGGDEFIVLTKDLEMFRKLNVLKTKDFCYGGVLINDYDNIAEAINKADEKLYQEKMEKKLLTK